MAFPRAGLRPVPQGLCPRPGLDFHPRHPRPKSDPLWGISAQGIVLKPLQQHQITMAKTSDRARFTTEELPNTLPISTRRKSICAPTLRPITKHGYLRASRVSRCRSITSISAKWSKRRPGKPLPCAAVRRSKRALWFAKPTRLWSSCNVTGSRVAGAE